MAKDPVCGMHVDEASSRFKSEHNGQIYYVCCEGCSRSFEEEPEKYLAGGSMGHDHGGHGR
jgi:Cu+-exporting ATPase